jgi:hypothetical protein
VTTRILFVGNSFVTRNDVPGLVRDLAASVGRKVEKAAIVAGGASLRRHLNSGAVADSLEQQAWRYVVLQEQSTLPIKNRRRYHENVREMHSLVTSAGAQTVLYMTWARRSAGALQAALSEATQAVGDELGSIVAPVGTAWQQVLIAHPEVELHAADGSHPNLAGSFLAACVLYGTLFQDRALCVAAPASLEMSPDLFQVLLTAARTALRLEAARAGIR